MPEDIVAPLFFIISASPATSRTSVYVAHPEVVTHKRSKEGAYRR